MDESTFWEGYVIAQNVDGFLNIEGYEIDKMDSPEKNGNFHKRYIFGIKALSWADESLSFEIYPGKFAQIHYDMNYNTKDGCFYGNWFFLKSKKHPYSVQGKGEAIIFIEDFDENENDLAQTIKQVAEEARTEYSEEIEIYSHLALNQFFLSPIDNSPAVKKLSKFSDPIKNYKAF